MTETRTTATVAMASLNMTEMNEGLKLDGDCS